jgi:glycosyltransferase involved in cell wall biosynthesis
MLEPWLWDKQGLWISIKKRIYWHLFAKAALSRATVIHAITPLEKKHLSKLFPSSRIEVIPNAIDVLDFEELTKKDIKKTILFLGRIEPKKGVDILLEAFANADLDSEWKLEIVGPVWSQNYINNLLKIIEARGIQARVRFLGPLFGLEKQEKIDTSWVLVAPSHSEVVGLVNLEASSRGVPTITTYQTGLYDWEDGGGVLIEPNVSSLTAALKRVCSWTTEERVERGKLSHHLIKSRYSWDVIVEKWMTLYASILNGECHVE